MKNKIRVGDIVKISPGTKYVERVGYKYSRLEFRWLIDSLANWCRISSRSRLSFGDKTTSQLLSQDLAIYCPERLSPLISDSRIIDALSEYGVWCRAHLEMAVNTSRQIRQIRQRTEKADCSWDDFDYYTLSDDLAVFYDSLQHYADRVFERYLLLYSGDERQIHYGRLVDSDQYYFVAARDLVVTGTRIVSYESEDEYNSYLVKGFATDRRPVLLSLFPLSARSSFLHEQTFFKDDGTSEQRVSLRGLQDFKRDATIFHRDFERDCCTRIPLRKAFVPPERTESITPQQWKQQWEDCRYRYYSWPYFQVEQSSVISCFDPLFKDKKYVHA